MTRQLEARREERQAKLDREVLIAVEYGLEEGISQAGAVLRGISVRWGGLSCLLTVRADFEEKPHVCFVGGEDLGRCMVKVMREGPQGKLVWRPDKYGGQS